MFFLGLGCSIQHQEHFLQVSWQSNQNFRNDSARKMENHRKSVKIIRKAI